MRAGGSLNFDFRSTFEKGSTVNCMTPPFSERSEFGTRIFAWLPPAVHSNCSERLWLHARTLLVALENRVGWPGDQIKDVRFLFSPFLPTPPLWPQKREYNAVSAIADEIWQYRTGGNLTMFDKDQTLQRKARSQVRQK